MRTEYREIPYLSVFNPNAGKYGKNADKNNSEYGLFLRSANYQWTFLLTSTYDWIVMKDIFDPLGLKVIKKLSETRWSARHDACSALLDGYSQIKSALFQVAENLEQKIETRATAKGLLNKINSLRITVLLCFWKTILERFNKNQFKLQRSNITLTLYFAM